MDTKLIIPKQIKINNNNLMIKTLTELETKTKKAVN